MVPPLDKNTISAVMNEMGRRGGKIGGKRALETMTEAQRSARAKKACQAAAKVRTMKATAKRVTVDRSDKNG